MVPDQDVTAHGAVVAGLAHQKGDHHFTALLGTLNHSLCRAMGE